MIREKENSFGPGDTKETVIKKLGEPEDTGVAAWFWDMTWQKEQEHPRNEGTGGWKFFHASPAAP